MKITRQIFMFFSFSEEFCFVFFRVFMCLAVVGKFSKLFSRIELKKIFQDELYVVVNNFSGWLCVYNKVEE
jgi:hypothetical protein